MDGIVFTKKKPPKDWDEAIQQTQTTLLNGLSDNFTFATKVLSEKTQNIKETVESGQAINKLKESGIQAGDSIGSRASELKSNIADSEAYKKVKTGGSQALGQLGAGAQSLKQKVQSQAFAKNLMTMFGKQEAQAPMRA